jgi:hypothetical protein
MNLLPKIFRAAARMDLFTIRDCGCCHALTQTVRDHNSRCLRDSDTVSAVHYTAYFSDMFRPEHNPYLHTPAYWMEYELQRWRESDFIRDSGVISERTHMWVWLPEKVYVFRRRFALNLCAEMLENP